MDYLEQHVNGEAGFCVVRSTVLVNIPYVLSIFKFHLCSESLVLGIVSEALQLANVAKVLTFATLLVVYNLDGDIAVAILLEFVCCLVFHLSSWSAGFTVLYASMWKRSGYVVLERIYESVHS